MPPTRRARRTRISPAAIAFRLAVYILTTWGTLALLASGLFPGAQIVTFGLALFTTIPIVAFAVWRGWPFYPGAAFRLLVVRPFAWFGRFGQQTFERVVVNGLLVGGTTNIVKAGSAAARALQNGFLRAYAALLVLGMVAVALYFLIQSA